MEEGKKERKRLTTAASTWTHQRMSWVCWTWSILTLGETEIPKYFQEVVISFEHLRRRWVGRKRGKLHICHAAEGAQDQEDAAGCQLLASTSKKPPLASAAHRQNSHLPALELRLVKGQELCHWLSPVSSCSIYSHSSLTSIVLGQKWFGDRAYKWKELNVLLFLSLLAT